MYFKCQSFVGQAFIFLKISIINEWLWFWRINVRLNDDYDQMEILLKHDLCKNISITRGQNSEVIIFNSIKNQSSLNLKQLGGIVFNGEWYIDSVLNKIAASTCTGTKKVICYYNIKLKIV